MTTVAAAGAVGVEPEAQDTHIPVMNRTENNAVGCGQSMAGGSIHKG